MNTTRLQSTLCRIAGELRRESDRWRPGSIAEQQLKRAAQQLVAAAPLAQRGSIPQRETAAAMLEAGLDLLTQAAGIRGVREIERELAA